MLGNNSACQVCSLIKTYLHKRDERLRDIDTEGEIEKIYTALQEVVYTESFIC